MGPLGRMLFVGELLEALDFDQFDDDFIFDNQMLAQLLYFQWRIGELSCPTRYFAEASSINFRRSCTYGIGVIATSWDCALARLGFRFSKLFPARIPGRSRGPGTTE